MLVIFSGTYGVGKTHFILHLAKNNNYKIIPTYTTRELRINEREKIHIGKDDFVKSNNKFLYTKEHFDEYYGIKKLDIELACFEKDVWMIDFPIEKVNEIRQYPYKLIVILPIDKAQIIDNLTIDNRINRIDLAIQDYYNNYMNLSSKYSGTNTLVVINYFDKFQENINLINSFLNY
jgi:guanylate kinase